MSRYTIEIKKESSWGWIFITCVIIAVIAASL